MAASRMTLVDTTKTSSFDDWAQGFLPRHQQAHMNCPGQACANPRRSRRRPGSSSRCTTSDGTWTCTTTVAHRSIRSGQLAYKCYDACTTGTRWQPAPYDGLYTSRASSAAIRPRGACRAGSGQRTGRIDGRHELHVCHAKSTMAHRCCRAASTLWKCTAGLELGRKTDRTFDRRQNYIRSRVTVQFPGLGGAIYIRPTRLRWRTKQRQPGALCRLQRTTRRIRRRPLEECCPCQSHEGGHRASKASGRAVGQTPRRSPISYSLYPRPKRFAPFRGCDAQLCDRKLVTLD